MDKFGRYKPVVIMSLLLNALFHHSLMLIPQQEIPGKLPEAYVMRHPETGNVEVGATVWSKRGDFWGLVGGQGKCL